MPNWTDNPPPSSKLNSQDEQRLAAIRKYADRLETFTAITVGLVVFVSFIAIALTAGGSSQEWVPALLSGIASVFLGVFFFFAVRLVCAAILFVCEHLAGL